MTLRRLFTPIALLVCSPTFAETLAHWRFEETPGFTEDSGPHELALSTDGTAPVPVDLPATGAGSAFPRTLTQPSAPNARASSHGTGGNFSRPHDAALAPAGPFTIEALVHRNGIAAGTSYIASRWQFADGATHRSWGLATAGSTPPAGLTAGELFVVLSGDGLTTSIVGSGLIVPSNTDAYVAAVYEPAQVRFYFRNLSSGTGMASTTVAHTISPLHPGTARFNIGAFNNGGNRWNGLIDEVRLSAGSLAPGQLLVEGEPASPAPILLLPGGNYPGSATVEISATGDGSVVRYTLDGTLPDASSPVYTQPFVLPETATLTAVTFQDGLPPSPPVSATYTILPFPLIGNVRPRDSREISSSLWSIGGETLDRGFAIYANYRDYLGPLGAKAIRLQAGWARTEQVPGTYDWAWLDEAVFDTAAQGLAPWINVSYGNPAYPGGGTPGLGGSVPSSAEGKAAWDAWLTAMVHRYKDVVTTWEIWNEPVGHVTVADYTDLYQRSARIIRAIQPEARLIAIAFAGINTGYASDFLTALQAADELHLVDEICYHAYTLVPESHYGQVTQLRNLVAGFAPHITLRQGENGAPSRRGGFGAITNYDWTEQTQAKWNLRRMMGDHGRDIPNNLFSIADMQYPTGNNDKGILLTDPATQQVIRPKEAYHAARHVYSIFDDRLETTTAWPLTHDGPSSLVTFRYRHRTDGRRLITTWQGGGNPAHNLPFTLRTFTTADAGLEDPVWVDLRTGEIRAIPAASITRDGGTLTLAGIPVYDSPVLIAERSLVLRPYDLWALDRFGPQAYQAPPVAGPLAGPAAGNLLHYALGGHSPTAIADPDGHLRLTFPRLRADVDYHIEVSQDLLHWQPAARNPGQPGATITWTDTAPRPRRFARLRLTIP